MYYAIKKIYSDYPNPVIISNNSNIILFRNQACSLLNPDFFTCDISRLKGKNLYSALKLNEEDKFRIRKFIKKESEPEIIFLNYLEYDFVIKIFRTQSDYLNFEFLGNEHAKKFMESVYHDSFLIDLSTGSLSLRYQNAPTESILNSSRLVNVYNQLAGKLAECESSDHVFFVLDGIFSEILQPDSFDYIEKNDSMFDVIFSRNSIFYSSSKIEEASIKWFLNSVQNTKSSLFLHNIQDELSRIDYVAFPGLKSKKSILIIPVFRNLDAMSLIFMSFSSEVPSDRNYENIFFMGIANLGMITLEKIRSNQEKKNFETQFGQKEKLIGMGNIIAGVAHEVNNPLSIMQLDLDELKSRCSEGIADAETSDVLKSLQEEIERMSFLVRQLKEYARPDNESPAVDEKNDIVSLFYQYPVKILLKSLRKNSIDIKIENLAGKAFVQVPKNRIIQIIMNLLTNASEALNSIEKNDKKIIIRLDIDEQGNAVVSVIDNGEGIAAGNAEKIFLPFFTTKKGDGTGLGLSISYSIAKKYGGNLYINKQNTEFTEFVLKFKIIDK